MKLAPRLVPQPLWGLSASRLLPQPKWKRIRADAMEASGGVCVICGASREKGMIGDEDWEYADGIATLARVQIICPDCNAVIHIGRTITDGYGDVARDHMCRVNGIGADEADGIIDVSFAEWRERSVVGWTIAVAPGLLARYPELSILDGMKSTVRVDS